MTGGAVALEAFRFAMEPTWLVMGCLAGLFLPFFWGLATSLVGGAAVTALTIGFGFGLTHAAPLTGFSLVGGTLALGLIFLVVWFLRQYIPVATG